MINQLFQTHDNREHLAMMERILGPLPVRMAMKSRTKYFSSKSWRLAWDDKSSAGRYVRENCKPLERYIPKRAHAGGSAGELDDWRDMLDLVAKMLIYEPQRRLSMAEALRHAFFAPMKNIQGGYRNGSASGDNGLSSSSASR